MARYRKVDVRVWNDGKFRRLSKAPPNGQTLWLYLMTTPLTTNIPGLFSAGEAGLAEALGWPVEGFRQAFAEIQAAGLAVASWSDRLIWIPNAIKYNQPESPNVIKGWRVAWDELPECDLKIQAFHGLKAFAKGLGEAFLEAFLEAFPEKVAFLKEAFPEAFPEKVAFLKEAFPEGCLEVADDSFRSSPNNSRANPDHPLANQEQEQEQEQDIAGESRPPPLRLTPTKPEKARKLSAQERLAQELGQTRTEVLGPDPLPDDYSISRLNKMLGPLLEVDREVLANAYGLFLQDEYASSRDPPFPLSLFASQWSRFVSMAARERMADA